MGRPAHILKKEYGRGVFFDAEKVRGVDSGDVCGGGDPGDGGGEPGRGGFSGAGRRHGGGALCRGAGEPRGVLGAFADDGPLPGGGDGSFVGGGFPGGGADAVLPSRGLCGGLRGSGALGVHLGIWGGRAGILPGNPVSPFSVLPAAVAVSGGERRPSRENPREVSGGGISPPGGGGFLRNGGKSGNSFIFFAVKRIQHVEEWGFPGQHVVFFM